MLNVNKLERINISRDYGLYLGIAGLCVIQHANLPGVHLHF